MLGFIRRSKLFHKMNFLASKIFKKSNKIAPRTPLPVPYRTKHKNNIGKPFRRAIATYFSLYKFAFFFILGSQPVVFVLIYIKIPCCP